MNYTDRSSQYLFTYAAAVRLDKVNRKRPQKLKCKAGFTQRGAACQKAKASSGDLTKAAIGAALVGGMGIAAARHLNQKPTESVIAAATDRYNQTPTWQKAALVGAIATATPPAAYMAARARYRSGFKESARMAEEKAKTIEVKKVKDREHTIVVGIGGMGYSDESPEVRSGQRIVRAAGLAFSQDKGKDFKLVPVDNSAGNVPEGRKRGNLTDQATDVANIFVKRLKDGRSQSAVDLAANVIAWADANPDKQIVMMGHSSGGFDVHEAQEILRIARPDLDKRLKSFTFGTAYFGCTNNFGESHTITNDRDVITNNLPTKNTKNFKDTTPDKTGSETDKSPDILRSHNQSPYFLNEEVKKFVAETIYKDANKYKKEPQTPAKKPKKQKPPKDMQQKTDSYILGYAQVIKLDKLPRKRPEKLKCRPGFEQRGAACQKIRNSVKSNPTDLAKLAIAATLVGGAGAAAYHFRDKLSPQVAKLTTREIAKEYRSNPTWKIAAAAGAVAIGAPPATYLAARARYRAGFGESARMAREKSEAIGKDMDDLEGRGWMTFRDDHALKAGTCLITKGDKFASTGPGNSVRAKHITLVANGFDGTDNLNQAQVVQKKMMGQDKLFADHHFVLVNNEGFSGKSSDPNNQTIEQGFKDTFINTSKNNRNPVAVRLAATAYAYHQRYPDLPINLIGYSGAGMATHEAAEILKTMGVKAQIANFGSPYFGMTEKVGRSVTFNNKYDYATEWTPVRDEVHINDVEDHLSYLKNDRVRQMLRDFLDGKEIKGDDPNDLTEAQKKKLRRRKKASKKVAGFQNIPENPFKN